MVMTINLICGYERYYVVEENPAVHYRLMVRSVGHRKTHRVMLWRTQQHTPGTRALNVEHEFGDELGTCWVKMVKIKVFCCVVGKLV